jgi:4,4'-diaponeurosporenoate glycosyltransferase
VTFISLALAAVLGGLGLLLLARVRRCDPPEPGLRPRISVIIPSRDEERTLPVLLASLARQSLAPLEVLVADDGSTDRTPDLAGAAGAAVVRPGPKPPGWQGKTWPAYRAALQARGELLVFLDADTRLERDGLARLAATHARQGGGWLTVEPHHETLRPYEQLSAFFNLLRVASVGGFNAGDRAPHGAFGPCLVCRRADYFAAGGHGRPEVRGQVLENFVLGQSLLRAGQRVTCREGVGVISMRMYPGGLGELCEGWSKAFVTGAGASRPAFLLLSTLWLTGAVNVAAALPAALAAGPLPGLLAGVLYLGMALQLHVRLGQVGRFSPLTALLFPVPLLAFFAIFLRSVYLVRVRRRVTWRGQRILLEGPRPGALLAGRTR